jgi:hypothetical protein
MAALRRSTMNLLHHRKNLPPMAETRLKSVVRSYTKVIGEN